MQISSANRPVWATLLLLATVAFAAGGCSRMTHRLQADREAYDAVGERNSDPRWKVADYSIEIDPRSRYADAYDPDHSPMPLDDPVSHHYMHAVNGMKGWKHWHDNGDRLDLENPGWREVLAGYVEMGDDDSVKLDVDSALKIAYVNSPSNQNQLETLYLSALDVTAERFRLDTQFFGGYDTDYAHIGGLTAPGFIFDPGQRAFIVEAASERNEQNRLTLGRRPFPADPALLARRRLATAGELLVGFANSFVFEFTGSDANLASSIANFAFIQPLLRGAGKDVALEQLTLDERTLLANLRAYAQFRQGFYTQVAIGELGVNELQRDGGGTNLTSFSGQGGVGGYIGLLQQRQQIRNSKNNLSLQRRTLARLIALQEAGQIDPVQVEQFRQSVENERADLLVSENALELDLDRFKTNTLGLPPDLPIELDDSLIRQFQLVAGSASEVQDSIVEQRRRVGELPDVPELEAIEKVLSDVVKLVKPVRRQLDDVKKDLDRMDQTVADREESMTKAEREQFQRDSEQLGRSTLAELNRDLQGASAELDEIQDGLSEETRRRTSRRLVGWLRILLRIVERSILVQARARLQVVAVEAIELEPREAFNIALANRLDFMNGRAALVDSWRQIQFNADALQSVLNVTASGDIRTARNNPVSFRAPTGTLRLGLEFDAPFTRLLERNAYRESLIEYQRSRRGLIQSRDSLHLGLRALLRTLEQLRENLEIQRLAVMIAIRRVDLTQSELDAPQELPQLGQPRPQFSSTTAFQLLGALQSLRDTQNNFMGAWLSYYAIRMRLSRELGIMMLDREGRWLDYPISGSDHERPLNEDEADAEELPPLPPAIPIE